jgi:hypothetical protein
MSDRDRMDRLREVSALKREMALADLTKAAHARERSRAQLAALDAESPATDLPALTDLQVRLAYSRWAEKRRADLNLTLARQTADWLMRRDAAALAFGRAEVLDELVRRLVRSGMP